MRLSYFNPGTPASACGIQSGCSDDAVLYSTTLIANNGQGGLAGTQFYFFEPTMLDSAPFQSTSDDISNATTNATGIPIARFFKSGPAGLEFSVRHIGLQIVNALGAAIPSPADMKTIADNGIFEAFLPGNTSADLARDPNGANPGTWGGFDDEEADIIGPVVQYPSHVGLFGGTTESASGVVSLGQPNLTMAKTIGQGLVIRPNDRMIARISFPAAAAYGQALNRGVGSLPAGTPLGTASAPPALGLANNGGPATTPPPNGPGVVAVRLFLFGQSRAV